MTSISEMIGLPTGIGLQQPVCHRAARALRGRRARIDEFFCCARNILR
jgi:hypothetical protein